MARPSASSGRAARARRRSCGWRSGLLTPDAGLVRFRGAPLDPSNVRAARRQMGYVVQDGGLFPHLTAVQNVELMARHLRWEPARIDARRDELVELTRFPADALERYPAQLSGGQRQRVGLMRALFLDPRCCSSTSLSAPSIRSCAPSCRTICRRSSPGSTRR